MQEYVQLTVDGAPVRVAEDTSVLEAALSNGICIPHLCHMPGISASGACRLCIVEVVERNRAKVTTSCSLDVREGMVIRTNTDRIRRLRRNLAELLVAQAPNSRTIQDIAVRCGVEDVRYPFRNGDCVQCGRCVRACQELWQARAIGFVGRGKDRKVDFPFGVRPDFCKRCGYCIDLCPMTITPCGGIMKPGEERLCGQCASQLSMERDAGGACVWCDLGEGLNCIHRSLV
jgi:NADH dehydrogenase/NADH:ubiquinone oxidoreductase subunit G